MGRFAHTYISVFISWLNIYNASSLVISKLPSCLLWKKNKKERHTHTVSVGLKDISGRLLNQTC